MSPIQTASHTMSHSIYMRLRTHGQALRSGSGRPTLNLLLALFLSLLSLRAQLPILLDARHLLPQIFQNRESSLGILLHVL